MKRQTLAACICAAITLCASSCFLFGEKDKTPVTASPSIIGKWQVTNMTDTNGQALPIDKTYPVPIKADTVKTFVNFEADSSLILSFSSKDDSATTKYYLDTTEKKLFVKEKKAYDTLAVLALDDSMMHLTLNNVDVKLKRLP